MAGPSWVVINEPSSYSGRSRHTLTADELFFAENTERADTLAESSDPNASYDYDDYALAVLDGQYYVFNTSGCSCPSLDETWSMHFKGDGPALVDYLEGLRTGDEAACEFLRECAPILAALGIPLRSDPPVPRQGYDW